MRWLSAVESDDVAEHHGELAALTRAERGFGELEVPPGPGISGIERQRRLGERAGRRPRTDCRGRARLSEERVEMRAEAVVHGCSVDYADGGVTGTCTRWMAVPLASKILPVWVSSTLLGVG